MCRKSRQVGTVSELRCTCVASVWTLTGFFWVAAWCGAVPSIKAVSRTSFPELPHWLVLVWWYNQPLKFHSWSILTMLAQGCSPDTWGLIHRPVWAIAWDPISGTKTKKIPKTLLLGLNPAPWRHAAQVLMLDWVPVCPPFKILFWLSNGGTHL